MRNIERFAWASLLAIALGMFLVQGGKADALRRAEAMERRRADDANAEIMIYEEARRRGHTVSRIGTADGDCALAYTAAPYCRSNNPAAAPREPRP